MTMKEFMDKSGKKSNLGKNSNAEWKKSNGKVGKKSNVSVENFPTDQLISNQGTKDQSTSNHRDGLADDEPRGERRNPDSLTRSVLAAEKASDDGESESVASAFERYWKAGMRKVDKLKARKAFERKCKDLNQSPGDFADELILDVHRRLDNKVFGFDRLHPTTYLNNERWHDDIPLIDPATGNTVGTVGEDEFAENDDGSFAL